MHFERSVERRVLNRACYRVEVQEKTTEHVNNAPRTPLYKRIPPPDFIERIRVTPSPGVCVAREGLPNNEVFCNRTFI